MFLRPLLLSLALVAAAPVAAAPADPPAQADRLLELMGVPEVVEVMRAEGLGYGEELAAEMLPGKPSTRWQDTVSEIYRTDRMRALVRDGFAEGMEGVDPSPLIAFFDSERGRRIVGLELEARRAMIDGDVEQAAREAYLDRREAGGDTRLAQIERFIAVNDLVDANLVGALNSNVMFYLGLVDGGALALTEDEILADVWSQEETTREDTREWLHAFLLTAYGPLDDAVLEEYIALSETPEGRAMNRALFLGFDRMYAEISYALGLALAREMASQEL